MRKLSFDDFWYAPSPPDPFRNREKILPKLGAHHTAQSMAHDVDGRECLVRLGVAAPSDVSIPIASKVKGVLLLMWRHIQVSAC